MEEGVAPDGDGEGGAHPVPEPQPAAAASQRIPEAVALGGAGGRQRDPSAEELCGEGTGISLAGIVSVED